MVSSRNNTLSIALEAIKNKENRILHGNNMSNSLSNRIKDLKIDLTSASIAILGKENPNYSPSTYISREQYMAITTPKEENHDLLMGNIKTLDYKATVNQYNGIKGMIESGQINDFNFRGYNGAEKADSAGQYLFWLQAHMQEIGGDNAQ